METSGVLALYYIEIILYLGNNRRPLQHNERDVRSILQMHTDKTKKML